MNPKVSVLIPSYNHGRFLADTIKSVLNQSYNDFELIVSDDCSSDNSREIINSFSDSRIVKIFSSKNVGTVRNLNSLISAAKGEYIATLGSDDIWYQSKLEKQVKYLDDNINVAACFTKVDIIDENNLSVKQEQDDIDINVFNEENKNQGQWIRRFYEDGNHLCHSSVLMRKSVHSTIGYYNISYRQLHDYDLWTRLINEYPIHIIDEELVGYRRIINSSDCVSANNDKNIIRLINENANIVYNMVSKLNSNVLNQGFPEKYLIPDNEDACNAKKYCLLKDYSLLGEKSSGLSDRFLFEHATDKMIGELEERYNIVLNDIYDATAQMNIFYPKHLFAPFIDAKHEIDALNMQIVNMNNCISESNRKLHELQASTSWKVTKPIRIFKNIIRVITEDNK